MWRNRIANRRRGKRNMTNKKKMEKEETEKRGRKGKIREQWKKKRRNMSK
jgi:hypothetical protein